MKLREAIGIIDKLKCEYDMGLIEEAYKHVCSIEHLEWLFEDCYVGAWKSELEYVMKVVIRNRDQLFIARRLENDDCIDEVDLTKYFDINYDALCRDIFGEDGEFFSIDWNDEKHIFSRL